ncbi:MAG: hypothetical protein Tp170SUR191951_80 [Prokaryotic dsDNA virus sp.]|nr:hypothetical protein [Pseudomonas sp.]MBS67373.1 hypothetical protein [Pseudomonas sp.]QDP55242.1 MAG: hypothetical protein Tp170SUR191951_80 [Prokaryotic dsDNA virus sp.]|tara:strand:+ start:2191 stop:2409 length:219 start_codon:yes stop_codon:yes gene_type:complete
MTEPKHPETADLARRALEASGCKTRKEFIAMFGDAIKMRTLDGWLAGNCPLPPLTSLMLREFVAGWRPTCIA